MRRRHPLWSHAVTPRSACRGDHTGLLAAGLVAATLGSSVLLVPQPLVLPIVATAMLSASALLAAYASRRAGRAESDRVGARDLAGGCALIGISAAELGEIGDLLELLALAPP